LPSVWEGASLLWGRSVTEAESERLSRNLAEVIDDLYRQHAPPRDGRVMQSSAGSGGIRKSQPAMNGGPRCSRTLALGSENGALT